MLAVPNVSNPEFTFGDNANAGLLSMSEERETKQPAANQQCGRTSSGSMHIVAGRALPQFSSGLGSEQEKVRLDQVSCGRNALRGRWCGFPQKKCQKR